MNKVSYKLSNVNIEERTATLRARPESHVGAWYKFDVELSPLLNSRIIQGRQDLDKMQYEEEVFTSTVNSNDFKENPLKVVKFINQDGTVKNYQVKLVSEAKPIIKYIKDMFGRRTKKYINQWYKKSQYQRYQEVQL